MSNVFAAIVASSIVTGAPQAAGPEQADGGIDAPATATTPQPAPMGADTVHLKSGGFIRGTVEEYEPRGTVVLRRSDGTVRTFEATEVERVALGGQEEPAQPTATAETTSSRSVPTPEDAVPRTDARVHLVRVDGGRDDVALQRKTGNVYVSGYGGAASGVTWETACTFPCGRLIDTNGAYFVNGLDRPPFLASKTLNLQKYGGQDVTLEVEGGRAGVWAGGFVLVIAGSSAAAISPLWFALDDYNKTNGAVLLATGTGALVGGIIMMLRGRHRVKAIPGSP